MHMDWGVADRHLSQGIRIILITEGTLTAAGMTPGSHAAWP
jgi:hypothetical protein